MLYKDGNDGNAYNIDYDIQLAIKQYSDAQVH